MRTTWKILEWVGAIAAGFGIGAINQPRMGIVLACFITAACSWSAAEIIKACVENKKGADEKNRHS